ncbi:MAG: putative murein peptide carboxypeptidase [Paenibacillus sp.]|jgi:muramoyltetrapeptide carboxypeptidase|nr:putative murein peptide carboxypeptidase [Paenibacillus sp.]
MQIRPPILRPGDTIGIVTLGSPLDASIINARIETLQAMGLRVVLGDYVYAQNGFLAGSDSERAADLMRMFLSDEVRLILPARGGVGVVGILPYLDYEAIARSPKWISGYSDITVLLNVLSQFTGLITLHSLLLIDFKLNTPAYNFNQFFEMTSVYAANRVIENPPHMPLISLVNGNVTGTLVGGNLTSFVGTLGTEYEIDTVGKILFLEDTHEPTNTVYRYLLQLKLAGKLDRCAGIIMGQCSNCLTAYNVDYDRLIRTFLVPLGVPLLTNLATGHGEFKAALPIGAMVNMDTYTNKLTVIEPVISL